MNIPEKYADRPNLYRVACELANSKDPDKTFDALAAILKAGMKGVKRS